MIWSVKELWHSVSGEWRAGFELDRESFRAGANRVCSLAAEGATIDEDAMCAELSVAMQPEMVEAYRSGWLWMVDRRS